MPITKIIIENFKGIRDRVEIPIRPITLLFGANSAGKSSILQALLYLRHLLDGGNPDVDSLASGGSQLDLGGFCEFVHDRDTRSKIRVGLSLNLDDDGLPEPPQIHNPNLPEYSLTTPEVDDIREITVELEVEWSPNHHRPFVTAYEVALDGVAFAAIHATPGNQAYLDYINPDHPVFSSKQENDGTEYDSDLYGALHTIFLARNLSNASIDEGGRVQDNQRLFVGRDVVPDFHLGLPEKWTYPPDPQNEDEAWSGAWIFSLLNRTVVGAGRLVAEQLGGIRYLGPIRKTPKRNFQPMLTPGSDRWADGSAAWDLICSADAHLDWLSQRSIRSLGLGLKLEQYRHFEVPVNSSLGVLIDIIKSSASGVDSDTDLERGIVAREIKSLRERVRLQLISESTDLELQPCEVGIGVSQVLPVAIGAMAPGYTLFAVEQPELHVHPAIQCNLGDLFAKQAIDTSGRTILLETHSEHLILRLLRRIRENTEGELPPEAPPLEPRHLSVLWVEQKVGMVSIKPIPVNPQGDFDEQWPQGFFEERANELF